jgi:predicted transcriptional regulator
MMSPEKAIVISIRPEHALNILNGSKTLELRKSVPKDFVGWVYVYVTKGKPLLVRMFGRYTLSDRRIEDLGDFTLSGKIVARFWFDEYVKYVDCIDCSNNENGYECENDFRYLLSVDPVLRKKTCLTSDEIEDYGNGKDLYAWHIKKLEVFDKPMALGEFYRDYEVLSHDKYGNEIYSNDTPYFQLKRGPQSWQYAYISGAKQ